MAISTILTAAASIHFACSTVEAGHGAIPVGFLLFLALPVLFESPFSLVSMATVTGWLAIAFLLVVPWFTGLRYYAAATSVGFVMLAGSWLCFLGISEPPYRSFTSLIGFAAWLVAWLVLNGRSIFRVAIPPLRADTASRAL